MPELTDTEKPLTDEEFAAVERLFHREIQLSFKRHYMADNGWRAVLSARGRSLVTLEAAKAELARREQERPRVLCSFQHISSSSRSTLRSISRSDLGCGPCLLLSASCTSLLNFGR